MEGGTSIVISNILNGAVQYLNRMNEENLGTSLVRLGSQGPTLNCLNMTQECQQSELYFHLIL
jgi:hypothetical protein